MRGGLRDNEVSRGCAGAVTVPRVSPDVAAGWSLDPEIDHLNHGSYGATPIPVLAAQQRWRDEMERNPVRFMVGIYQDALEVARNDLAGFVGADAAGLVFVDNATSGVNAVLRSLEDRLSPGDEVLITDHTYNACRNAAVVSAAKRGASVVIAEVPFPIASPVQAVDAILARVSERTRIVIVDHVTSPTALILPVEEIITALEPEVEVLVDGAHAPGMVPLGLSALGASYVVGNCHKWVCAAKGAGYLYAREDRRPDLMAAVISHGYNGAWPGSGTRFHAMFDWTGTDDPTAWLSVPDAIAFMATTHRRGWDGVRRANHELALAARTLVLEALGLEAPAPGEMIGSMASIALPAAPEGCDETFDPLMISLRDRWRIEVPVFTWPARPGRLLRLSAQRYNDIEQYERLAHALRIELSAQGAPHSARH